jgi:hypothetical protein
MTTSAANRITVDLEPHGPPIQGSLRSGSDPSHPFTGWIGLLSALETAIQRLTQPSVDTRELAADKPVAALERAVSRGQHGSGPEGAG